MSSLSDKQINMQLEDLPGWQRDGNSIVKTYHFSDFIEAMSFMNQAAFHAEAIEHHPEWRNTYNIVEVRLTNQDTGGISSLDIRLAKRMEHIVQPKRL
ncbi:MULTISPECIES: 4a-hydroxytetrahydrobiopterin dehydratase [unclassified Psychrobacter]|jgi:4a-hydroxytetrahydrobiopterin dehydratase|uniref:4a-hydroxytetrahydrobiopterin dehydratase n=1 Tax=unclassified Psychrobacter TaxID=196806 RepID=UPI0018893EDA|nr:MULTISPECIES: 4a-hydroxytetrahydrobiopterin dehydratase [unclassified Psychrobacter]MBF2719001.1 4a-hydroxytetrahydrobiopterin dehydratase [Psychrobacter sp. NG254]MBH0005365.1 4a-hydroxytetrahydrobiopterin dehydratase [Psychrobacter sp. SWN149]MBI0425866.1 4a-hydroxytetrahydrobiopterin dehydratase [Psychrobacter sp. NG27]